MYRGRSPNALALLLESTLQTLSRYSVLDTQYCLPLRGFRCGARSSPRLQALQHGLEKSLALLGGHVAQPASHRASTEVTPRSAQPAEPSEEKPGQANEADRLPIGNRVKTKNFRHQPVP